ESLRMAAACAHLLLSAEYGFDVARGGVSVVQFPRQRSDAGGVDRRVGRRGRRVRVIAKEVGAVPAFGDADLGRIAIRPRSAVGGADRAAIGEWSFGGSAAEGAGLASSIARHAR